MNFLYPIHLILFDFIIPIFGHKYKIIFITFTNEQLRIVLQLKQLPGKTKFIVRFDETQNVPYMRITLCGTFIFK